MQNLPGWNSMVIIVTWDDSDAWYDHVMPQIVSQSNDPEHDALVGRIGLCGHARTGEYQDRCGYGPRLPLLTISPYAKVTFIDHKITDQTSIIKFIEDNWGLGRIGNQSFDAKAGSLMNMFDFTTAGQRAQELFLNPFSSSSIQIRNLMKLESCFDTSIILSVLSVITDRL
ncbi:MAG: alkaline phosphatase family protein [Candidatus Nitrosopolaris sp.]